MYCVLCIEQFIFVFLKEFVRACTLYCKVYAFCTTKVLPLLKQLFSEKSDYKVGVHSAGLCTGVQSLQKVLSNSTRVTF